MRGRLVLIVLIFAAALFFSSAASAQFLASPFGTGIFSGSDASTQIPRPIYFQRRLDSSKLRAGPFFFKPYFGLRDAAIVSDFGGPLNNLNFDDPNPDLLIAVGAGIRGYVSPYRRSMLAFHALPQYNWQLENRDQQRLTGSYGVGSFNYFGRLGVELSQRRTQTQNFFAADAPVLTTNSQDIGRFALEYRFWRDLRFFGTFVRRDLSSKDEREGFSGLNRRSDETRFGVIYQMPRNLKFAVLRSEIDVDFGVRRELSSLRVTDEIQISKGFHRVGLSLILQEVDITARSGSRVRDTKTTLGRIGMPITPRTSTSFIPYAVRTIDFASVGEFSDIVRDRVGLAFRTKFREYASLRLAVEVGQDDFIPLRGSTLERTDDVVTVGGRLNLTLPWLEKWFVPSVNYTRSEYSSNLVRASRTVSTFTFNFRIQWPWIPGRLKLPWERFAWGDSGGSGW